MASLDRKLKLSRTLDHSTDRFTRLPDELLTRILSMLPTKDAAAAQVLSKRMPRAFCCITNVDLDDLPVSHCELYTHMVERSSLFESFVDNVLHKCSQSQQPLTRFRLRFGGDKTTFFRSLSVCHTCRRTCFPKLEPARLYAWISYPLAHSGLRELDLSFHVPYRAKFKLPPGLFARPSLEVLTLDSNLVINSRTEILPICLPILKILNLHSFFVHDHGFVTKLVSNCPALEDLSISHCSWEKAARLTISSHSLRRFTFIVHRQANFKKCNDLMHIDTPNLQYFRYSDNLALKFSINMHALVEACIYVPLPRSFTSEAAFLNQLSLARALTNVQHLSLLGWFPTGCYHAAKLKNPLPMFCNLKTLRLDSFCVTSCSARWDIVLLLIFHRSPLLEELVFMEGCFSDESKDIDDVEKCCLHDPNGPDAAALEAASSVLAQTIPPSCCESHLKRIRIYNCSGCDQELNMIRFLLGKTSVLEELVISMLTGCGGIPSELEQFKNRVQVIPRASNSCSIIYSDDKADYDEIEPAPFW